ARRLNRVVEIVTGLDVHGNAVAAGCRNRFEVLLGRLSHQVDVDYAVHAVDLLGDRREHDRADRDRLDEVPVADVEMEDAHAGDHQRLDLLAEPREVARVQGRLDFDGPHPVAPRHDAPVYCCLRRAMKNPLVRWTCGSVSRDSGRRGCVNAGHSSPSGSASSPEEATIASFCSALIVQTEYVIAPPGRTRSAATRTRSR